jgi:dephospho-CoA kinase
MRIIGLTGGIASGKSTVARLLAEGGIPVIDADALARRVVAPGSPALAAIARRFGPGVMTADGTLDRAALARIVFADPGSRRELEALTHPAIADLAKSELAALEAAGTKVAVYMAPLLLEAGVSARVDEIWVVFADHDTQVRRIMARDRISREEAEARIAAQMPMEEKARHGRIVISNQGTLQELEEQVREIVARETKRPAG